MTDTKPRIIVERVNPPIPIRSFDWVAYLDGYEPGSPQGYGSTAEEAVSDLSERMERDK